MVQGSLASLLFLLFTTVGGFVQPSSVASRTAAASTRLGSTGSTVADDAASLGFGKTATTTTTTIKEPPQSPLPNERDYAQTTAPLAEIKRELIELLPRMTGRADEFRQVEGLVNALEALHVPAQTLAFLNLAMQGSWQLLFSTNLAGSTRPNPRKFRLRELVQRIDCRGLTGSLTNAALWDLSEETTTDAIAAASAAASFECTGTFRVECSYTMKHQEGGARMGVTLDEHVLRLSTGSAIPSDVPALVGLLHRAMPKELFDPSDHAVDTTYLDADLRIARYTGARMEGVRDIFIRQGSLEIHPE